MGQNNGPDVMNAERQARKIATIRSLDELAGYEAQARTRGLLPEETVALAEKRRELSKGKAR